MGWMLVWGIGLVGLAIVLAGVNSIRFRRGVRREARSLCRGSAPPLRLADLMDRRDLPAPVRHYLGVALAGRHEGLCSVRMKHGGWIASTPGGIPRPIDGEQWLAADPPGLVWWGRIRVFPGIWIEARDRVIGGEANNNLVFESIATLANERGPEIDRSSLLRLLSDLMLIPSAYLDARYVTWETVDERHARVSLRLQGKEVTGEYEFGDDWMPRAFRCERYRDTKEGPVLTPFVGRPGDWRRVEGMLVPFSLTQAWVIDGRELPHGHWRVQGVEADPPGHTIEAVPAPPGLPTLLPVR